MDTSASVGGIVRFPYGLSQLAKYDEAISCFDKAIEIDPKNTEAWNNEGQALSRLAKYDEAISCFDKAIEIDPNFADAWYNKSLATYMLGRSEEAEEYSRKSNILNKERRHKLILQTLNGVTAGI
jgi:tetratricopeptide (TPR) repeat protein